MANFLLALGGRNGEGHGLFFLFLGANFFSLFPPLALFNFLSRSRTFTVRLRRRASQVIDWTCVAPHTVNHPVLPPPLDHWNITNSQITSILGLGAGGLTKKRLVPFKENCEKGGRIKGRSNVCAVAFLLCFFFPLPIVTQNDT